jgi:hypothetical protein
MAAAVTGSAIGILTYVQYGQIAGAFVAGLTSAGVTVLGLHELVGG